VPSAVRNGELIPPECGENVYSEEICDNELSLATETFRKIGNILE
jgi:hypothetical protein